MVSKSAKLNQYKKTIKHLDKQHKALVKANKHLIAAKRILQNSNSRRLKHGNTIMDGLRESIWRIGYSMSSMTDTKKRLSKAVERKEPLVRSLKLGE